MKNAVKLLTILLCIVLLCSCNLTYSTSDNTTQSSHMSSDSTNNLTEKSDLIYNAIEKCYKKWTGDTEEVIFTSPDTAAIYSGLADITGDGIPELFIGHNYRAMVYEIYTLDNINSSVARIIQESGNHKILDGKTYHDKNGDLYYRTQYTIQNHPETEMWYDILTYSNGNFVVSKFCDHTYDAAGNITWKNPENCPVKQDDTLEELPLSITQVKLESLKHDVEKLIQSYINSNYQ